MPITEAFTASAAVAALVNAWFLVRCFQRGRAIPRSQDTWLAPEEEKELRRIARAFILVWVAILATDLLVLAAGIGILAGLRVLGYLLALMPVGSTLAGFFALRGFYD